MTTAPVVVSEGRRIALLAAQAFCLGLMTAWVMIPGSAVFLEVYGSDLLPYTYIGAAVASIAASTVLAATLRRRPLVAVAERVLAMLAVGLVVAWVGLRAGATWISFGLVVLVPMLVPIGFIFVVGQAGMLLDVRALKARYARVIAGFASGFVAGGVLGPMLIAAVGRTEDLVLGGAATAAAFLALVAVTRAANPAELDVVAGDDHGGETPGIRVLLEDRYLVLIVAFQMLSALGSQWLDFLVFDRAAQRYSDTQELAQFLGRFTAITFGVDILFLLLVAGLLMRRFGLRYGLTANPGGVLAVVTTVIVMTTLQGSASTVVFVLIVLARLTDLVLSDGASRNALSAAYQVVAPQLRQEGQARVEGLAVPLAIGLSGVGLLLIRTTVGTNGLTLTVLTAVVVLAWGFVGVRLYHGYRISLLDSLRYRSLDPGGLPIDDPNSLRLIDQLIDSDDPRDVRVGLDALEAGGHPALADRLVRLAEGDERTALRTEALERLVAIDPSRAAAVARVGLDDADPGVRATAVLVLGRTGSPGDLVALARHEDDPDTAVEAAVASAMVHLGSPAIRAAVASRIAGLAASEHREDRLLAAAMLERCDPDDDLDRRTLRSLIVDADDEVAIAALDAVQHPVDDELVDALVQGLRDRRTAGAAVAALVRSGPAALPAIDDGLGRPDVDRRAHELAIRVCREIGGDRAVTVLQRHLAHPDRDVSLAVLRALGAVVDRPVANALAADLAAVIGADLDHAARVLNGLVLLGPHPWADPVRDALVDERDLLRRRLVAALAVRHGPEALRRVTHQLGRPDPRSHALALEWLDVTLAANERPVVAMLEPGLSDPARWQALGRRGGAGASSVDALLFDLIHDKGSQWRRPWVQACALHAAAARTEVDRTYRAAPDAVVEPVLPDTEGIVAETIAALRARRAASPAVPDLQT